MFLKQFMPLWVVSACVSKIGPEVTHLTGNGSGPSPLLPPPPLLLLCCASRSMAPDTVPFLILSSNAPLAKVAGNGHRQLMKPSSNPCYIYRYTHTGISLRIVLTLTYK